MPYQIIPLTKKGRYMVINIQTGQIRSKNTTLKNAEAQIRLLESLHSRKRPVASQGRGASKRRGLRL